MITLKNIIQTEFENVTEDEVVNQLSEHKLYGVIIQTIELVNAHLANKEQQLKSYGTIQVSHIASSVLIRVNEYLKLLDNRQKDVWELKQLVGSIFKRLLMMISAALPKQAKQKFAISLEISLKETCLIHGYKFKELVKFLGLDTLAYVNWIAATDDSIVPTAEQRELIPGYV